MTGWWGIYSSKKQDDMLWPDMTIWFIVAYDIPYPGGIGVPQLGQPCCLRVLRRFQDPAIEAVKKHERCSGRKTFSEENFDAEGVPPF